MKEASEELEMVETMGDDIAFLSYTQVQQENQKELSILMAGAMRI